MPAAVTLPRGLLSHRAKLSSKAFHVPAMGDRSEGYAQDDGQKSDRHQHIFKKCKKSFFHSFHIDILCPFEVVEYFQNEGPSRFLMITSQTIYNRASLRSPIKSTVLQTSQSTVFLFFLIVLSSQCIQVNVASSC